MTKKINQNERLQTAIKELNGQRLADDRKMTLLNI